MTILCAKFIYSFIICNGSCFIPLWFNFKHVTVRYKDLNACIQAPRFFFSFNGTILPFIGYLALDALLVPTLVNHKNYISHWSLCLVEVSFD